MSFTDLFKSGTHRKNLGHFAAIVSLAAADGEVKDEELLLIRRFAERLDITREEFAEVIKDPKQFPIIPPGSADNRLGRMLDFFKLIYVDSEMDEAERKMVERYAIALGYTEKLAEKLIKRSIEIFNGGLDLEDYRYLLNRK